MPTVLFIHGFRFFFYSNENDEPIHVHVEKADANGKIWLMPEIKIAYLHNFNKNEERQILQLITLNFSTLIQKWNEYFSQ